MASLHDRSLFFSSNAIPPFRAFAKVIIGGETDTGVVAMRCPLVCGSPVAKFSRIESSCSNILLLAMGAFFFFFFLLSGQSFAGWVRFCWVEYAFAGRKELVHSLSGASF